MPINNYTGNTYVAFMDISGFKQLMKKGDAVNALDKFYSYGYNALCSQGDEAVRVEGLFISDSAVLFLNSQRKISQIDDLKYLLEIIKQINIHMAESGYMLTTSIAYGHFSYDNRIEFQGIAKNPIYGGAYVKAFLDNENSLPKILPGHCRIVVDDELNELVEYLKENDFPLLLKAKRDRKHIEFYWNLRCKDEIEKFESEFQDTYNMKYSGMLSVIRKNL